MPISKVKATYSELVLGLLGLSFALGPILLLPFLATGSIWALLFPAPFVALIVFEVFDMIKAGEIGATREDEK